MHGDTVGNAGRVATVAVGRLVAGVALAAVLAPWISPQDPLAQDLFLGRLPPVWQAGSEPGFWLGTDSLGRDVLSRILHGARSR